MKTACEWCVCTIYDYALTVPPFSVAIAIVAVAASATELAPSRTASAVDQTPICRAAHLGVSLSFQGATGHLVGFFKVRNRGPRCLLRGRPRLTLRTLGGTAIPASYSRGSPQWRLTSRRAPGAWPVVPLARGQRAGVWLDLTNWCRRNGERVRFQLAWAGGTIARTAPVSVRCESAAAPVSVGVGPFEPVS